MATVMKASDFAKKAEDIAKNYKTLYVLGCFGAPLSAAHKERYITKNSYNSSAERKKKINAASADTFGFDCVCLLKGIFWGWSGKTNATYGGAKYASNGVPDKNADQMFSSYCTGQSTDFKNIEVGEFVWMTGHIGVYIGNGLAVECTPIWKDGVQITAVGNIGKKSGYNTRTWTKHGKSKFLDYTVATPAPSTPAAPKPSTPTTNTDKLTDAKLLELVRKTIRGDFGNGKTREKKLGSYFKEVQRQVNLNLSKGNTRWNKIKLY